MLIDNSDLFLLLNTMDYSEIEIEWMKEILRDKERELEELRTKNRMLQKENEAMRQEKELLIQQNTLLQKRLKD